MAKRTSNSDRGGADGRVEGVAREASADGGGATLKLTTLVGEIPGVRAKEAAALRAMGLKCVAHLVNHLPHRHELEQAESEVTDLAAGRIISARGEVTATRVVGRGSRPRFEAVLVDHTGRLDLVWFNQLFLKDQIHPGTRLWVQGKAKRLHSGLQLANPRYKVLTDETAAKPAGSDEDRLRPVYPATEALASEDIGNVIAKVLDPALVQIEDHLPAVYRAERNLPGLSEAYRMLHRPASEDEAREGRRRLAYDELLLLQLGVHLRRAHLRRKYHAPALKWTVQIDTHIRKRLPFSLTDAQESVIREVAADLTKPVPANRLIQGDVGAGKTVIALYAMLLAAAAHRQAALMAPTELLAEQHCASISKYLKGSDVRVELLTGSIGSEARASALDRIATGESHLVIGTHALLTEGVRFDSLAVAVIDEQHRFGVHQRARLREKVSDPTSVPHTLVMTATPIPRTMSLTIFGDLDVSELKGMPPGRTPVRTRLVGRAQRADVYAFVRARIEKGEQSFVVVPAVGGEDGGDEGRPGAKRIADVRTTLAELASGPLVGRRVEAVHGQLKRAERESIMERFRAGNIDVLVATTVIEVGVDVPNATIMVIEQADRFGLAQLHQLRGRVGRGPLGGACILVADPATADAEARLKSVVSTTDGFKLAEVDFSLRGPGDVFGGRQSGIAPFRVAEFPRDTNLLMMARRDASAWIERSPELSNSGEALVRSRLMKMYGKSLGLGDIA